MQRTIYDATEYKNEKIMQSKKNLGNEEKKNFMPAQ